MTTHTVSAFVSYSHEDAVMLDRLKVHLKPLAKRYGFIVWDDRKLRAGDKWRVEIEKNLESADVIIILLSADFLASDFVMDYEYPKALAAASDRGAKIVILMVGPCLHEEFELSEFHFVNNPTETLQDVQSDDLGAKQERILMQCAAVIRDYLQEATAQRMPSTRAS